MDPRLRLDITWADLASALAPGRGDPNAAIASIWPEKFTAPFLSVRTAFDALLQALAVSPGDEIVMSAVNIESMAEVAETYGAKLVPVDIDIETLAPAPSAVRAAIGPRTRMILIAHLFGARVPMEGYAALKAERVTLVEDCAQGWGGGYRGAAEADVSLFSYGPIKRRTALGGAVAAFNDTALGARCNAIQSGYPRLSDLWFVRRVLKFATLKLASEPGVYGLVMGAVELATGDAERAIGAVARGFPAGDLISRLRMRPPWGMLRLLARRLSQYEDDAARVAAAREVLEALGPELGAVGAGAKEHYYWLLPLLVAEPGRASRMLRGHGFDATRGATSLRALGGASMVNARRLIEHVLYVPAPWEMSPRRRQRLIELAGTLEPLERENQEQPLAVDEPAA